MSKAKTFGNSVAAADAAVVEPTPLESEPITGLPCAATVLETMVRNGLCVLTRIYKGQIQMLLVPDNERKAFGMPEAIADDVDVAAQLLAKKFCKMRPRHPVAEALPAFCE